MHAHAASQLLYSRGVALSQFSPWYHAFPSNDPSVQGLAEAAELSFYHARLSNITAWLRLAASRAGLHNLGAENGF